MKYYKIIDEEQVFFTGNVLKAEEHNILNPTEEQMLEAGWLVYEEPEISDEQKLAIEKAKKIMQIEEYDASPSVEQFTINGTPMWLGHELRQQIITSAGAYLALGSDTMTKVFNGQEFTFSISTWIQMLNALEVYAAEALNATERHKNNVKALTTVQEVQEYDFTINYPTQLSF